MTESDINKIEKYYADKYLTFATVFAVVTCIFGFLVGVIIVGRSPYCFDRPNQLLKDYENLQSKFNATQIWMKKHYVLMSIVDHYDSSVGFHDTAIKLQLSELQQKFPELNKIHNNLHVVKPYIDTLIMFVEYSNHSDTNWRNIFIFMSLLFLLDFALVFYIVLYMLLKTYQAIYSTLYTLICWVLEMFFEFLDLINPFTKVHIVQKKRRYRQ